MRYCSNCGRELQDDMQFCPSCGTPVQATSEDSIVDETVVVEEKVPRKKHKGLIAAIIVFALLAGAWFLYSNVVKIDTYNQFVDLYNTLAEGARKAETANLLIIDVWKNSIWKTTDERTDKYTKENEGNGEFYEDFNDALTRLYDNQDFIDDLAEIYSLQIEAESLIKDLAKHPKAFDEEYLDFKDCYNLFVKFTNMSLDASGSLNSFTDAHNELDEKIADRLRELDIYFD